MKVTGSYPIAYELRGHCKEEVLKKASNKDHAVTKWVATRKSDSAFRPMCRMAHRAEGFLCYHKKNARRIFLPAKTEIYKNKWCIPQKEEKDDRFKIFKRKSGSCKTEY